MMRISKVEAQALATFVGRIRPDWDHPGIVAAIEKAAGLGSAAAIGAALCRLAENYELRTPACLSDPGRHWSGTTTATRLAPVMCPEHPSVKSTDCERSGPCGDAIRATDHAAGLAKVRAVIADRPRTPTDHSEPIPARAERADRSKA